MIHGAGIRRAEPRSRNGAETTTMPVEPGPRRDRARKRDRPSSTCGASVAKRRPRAAAPLGRAVASMPDLGGGLGDLAQDRVARRPRRPRPARARRRRGRRRGRGRAPADELERGGAHRRARALVAASSSSAATSVSVSPLVRPAPSARRRRAAPRTSRRRRRRAACRARARGSTLPGRLAHRRRAQGDADVAGGHQRPEPLLVDVLLADDALTGQAEPLQPAIEVEAGRDGADEQQPRVRTRSAQARERLEQLRDPLARVQVAEAADQRARPRSVPARPRRARPGRVRDPPDRPLVAGRARPLLDVARVDDQARSRGRAPRRRAGSPPAASPRAAGSRLSSTPCASRRPTTPPSRSIASR